MITPWHIATAKGIADASAPRKSLPPPVQLMSSDLAPVLGSFGKLFRVTVVFADKSPTLEVVKRFADQDAAHSWGMARMRDPLDGVSVVDIARKNAAMCAQEDWLGVERQVQRDAREGRLHG